MREDAKSACGHTGRVHSVRAASHAPDRRPDHCARLSTATPVVHSSPLSGAVVRVVGGTLNPMRAALTSLLLTSLLTVLTGPTVARPWAAVATASGAVAGRAVVGDAVAGRAAADGSGTGSSAVAGVGPVAAAATGSWAGDATAVSTGADGSSLGGSSLGGSAVDGAEVAGLGKVRSAPAGGSLSERGVRVVDGAVPRGGFGWPLAGFPTVLRAFDAPDQPYGRGHRGVDLGGRDGQPVLAAGAGIVAFAGPVAGRPVVSIDHPNGLRTTYEPVLATVTAGQHVARGDPIGTLQAGHPGCTAAACLHWGVRRGEEYLDPLWLLSPGPVRLLPTG